jgi:hypothetical protein
MLLLLLDIFCFNVIAGGGAERREGVQHAAPS